MCIPDNSTANSDSNSQNFYAVPEPASHLVLEKIKMFKMLKFGDNVSSKR
jgi:hypothetical protein